MAFKQTTTAGGDFELAPTGTHLAVCTQLIDLGTMDTNWGPKRKIRLGFEIDELREDGKPFLVTELLTLSLNEKATLRKRLEAWRGQPYGDDEEVDISGVVGRSGLVTVVHSEDGKYANIASISPLMRGMEPLKPKGDTIVFDCDAPDLGELGKLSDKMREKVEASPEYRAAMGKPSVEDEARAYANKATGTHGQSGYSSDFDDDIPF